jgi:PAS domain S-box-containing protein
MHEPFAHPPANTSASAAGAAARALALAADGDVCRLLVDEAADMISRHDREGRFLFVSPAVYQILGEDPENLAGTRLDQSVLLQDVRVVTAAFDEARRTGATVTFEYRRRHRNGHPVWLESRVRFVGDAGRGDADHAVCITRDIARRKAFEQELLAARERAEALSHTKSRFLANMSHELRTPLNAIIGFSDIMVREMFGELGNDRYREYAKLVNDSGSLLLDLINDVLDMSKIEAGKYELHIEEFDVAPPVAAVVHMLSPRAAEKGLNVRSAIDPVDLRAVADQRVLKQVLLNLLSNAVKFTEAGGTVDIRATAVPAGMELSVTDNGIGIQPEFLSRIAQPFEQASNETTRTHGGSGLGLSLVKSLVALHGGAFSISSTPGAGTCVTVLFPWTEKGRTG